MGPIKRQDECWVDDNPTRTDWEIPVRAAKADGEFGATQLELRAHGVIDNAELACEGISKWALMKIAVSALAAGWRFFRDR